MGSFLGTNIHLLLKLINQHCMGINFLTNSKQDVSHLFQILSHSHWSYQTSSSSSTSYPQYMTYPPPNFPIARFLICTCNIRPNSIIYFFIVILVVVVVAIVVLIWYIVNLLFVGTTVLTLVSFPLEPIIRVGTSGVCSNPLSNYSPNKNPPHSSTFQLVVVEF